MELFCIPGFLSLDSANFAIKSVHLLDFIWLYVYHYTSSWIYVVDLQYHPWYIHKEVINQITSWAIGLRSRKSYLIYITKS